MLRWLCGRFWSRLWTLHVAATVACIAQSSIVLQQGETRFNPSSFRGLPLSSVDGTPPGSDGRLPTTGIKPTPDQFLGAVPFAASVNGLDGADASGGIVVRLSAKVGSPFLSRVEAYLFGQVIPPPLTDENGAPLTGRYSSEQYWSPQPYYDKKIITNITQLTYYYSPSAQQVYANRAGSTTITWVSQIASPNSPSGDETNKYYTPDGVSFFPLLTTSFIVSESAVQPTQRMYWTDGGFSATGLPVSIPKTSVPGGIRFAFYDNFPQYVPTNLIYQSFSAGGALDSPAQTNTLWIDGGILQAYNQVGRILLELLGDTGTNGAPKQLGIEIIDVAQKPMPVDVSVNLGELMPVSSSTNGVFREGSPVPVSGDSLYPQLLSRQALSSFVYKRHLSSQQKDEYYAVQRTFNQNDSQLFWLIPGQQGVLWPFVLSRYHQDWPTNISAYSHYLRPPAISQVEAELAAVQLPANNVPQIAYQDPLDKPRAFITPDYHFYTWLDANYPAHRTLLQFTYNDQVRFERVFSWLDSAIDSQADQPTSLVGSVAADLPGWVSNAGILQGDLSAAGLTPRYTSAVVNVGDRIVAPPGEIGDGSFGGNGYLAGYINQSVGTAFSVSAYIDPLANGFSLANLGSIIPVNAGPVNQPNQLEVLWFRTDNASVIAGFQDIYWPSVVGRYRVQWPAAGDKIVLASNAGSGPLKSLEAKGHLYIQNDSSQPGYNPNEEHALMQGGQAFALRDDLNITTAHDPSGPYSSDPFVLVEYIDSDGRPNQHAFHVVREDAAHQFNFAVTAGTILQPPMPLPLLNPPLAPQIVGVPPTTLNQESWALEVSSLTRPTPANAINVELAVAGVPAVRPYFPLVLTDTKGLSQGKLEYFYPINVNFNTNAIDGFVSATNWFAITNGIMTGSVVQYQGAPSGSIKAGDSVVVVDTAAEVTYATLVNTVNASMATISLDFGTNQPPPTDDLTLHVIVPDGSFVLGNDTWFLASTPLPPSFGQGGPDRGIVFKDRKGELWVSRGPNVPGDASASTIMQFYYATLPGFYFPSVALSAQPSVGTITPYLRTRNSDGTFAGDPIYGNSKNAQVPDGNALSIAYNGVWPDQAPVLQMAETLTVPTRGLPAVRGQSSLQVLYQQSIVTNGMNVPSVVLHDPTRAKVFMLSANPADGSKLGVIPPSVQTQAYQGKTYFPQLPPHLVQRFYFDPAVGPSGGLTFIGQFVSPPTGDSYLLLNVLSQSDLAYLTSLCSSNDPVKPLWDAAITNGLQTAMQQFAEDPTKPGAYSPIPGATVNVGPGQIAAVTDENVAVDSYALTAVGPGAGYVTLVAGNGINPTQTNPDDPVSLLVLRVGSTLYRGQLDIVPSDNPLSEKSIIQQVVDLAGLADQYDFDWRYAAPVDGNAPNVYGNTATNLLTEANWSQLLFPLPTDTPANVAKAPGNRTAVFSTASSSPSLAVVSGFSLTNAAITFDGVNVTVGNLVSLPPIAASLVVGNNVVLTSIDGTNITGTITALSTAPFDASSRMLVALDSPPTNFNPVFLSATSSSEQAQCVLSSSFGTPNGANYSAVWLSLNLDPNLACKIYLDGQLVVTANTGSGDSVANTAPAEIKKLMPAPLSQTGGQAYRLGPELLAAGTPKADGTVTHQVSAFLFSSAPPNVPQQFDLFISADQASDLVMIDGSQWLPLGADHYPDGVRAIFGGQADVLSLSDNYLIMRYRAKNHVNASWVYANPIIDSSAPDSYTNNVGWSQWTDPELVEGWIKRVLAGINPFNQRVTDFFNNSVNTDVSLLTEAGPRWEGDVALNSSTLNNDGLIQIYETVLNRGKALSIGAGIDYGPANDALLLAAGYISDLYTFLGDAAWADANNPTIGITTSDPTFGQVATSLFPFQGEVATLLDQQLALLRGRDDFAAPGVETAPAYNRLYWNYTRGIAAGEVVYALNYNIQPNPDAPLTGSITAADAEHMFPQGHGDAYGHYLTALTGYYGLLMNPNFTWVPQTEAVTVLGVPVEVGYLHERKFAAAAAAVAKTGSLIYDLQRRSEYVPGATGKWGSLSTEEANNDEPAGQSPRTRFWGSDHWAARVGQGALFNWVVGNALLPAVDPDPTHQGIQKIDRTTVPELQQLPTTYAGLQTALDAAEGGLNPLGLVDGALAFDVNPSDLTGSDPQTHFEQVYTRAVGTLNNAVIAFNDATEFTRLMRSEENTIASFQAQVDSQEAAYTNSLIEIYGTPYSDDIGPGQTYAQGYAGPDYFHYPYIDMPESIFFPAEQSIIGTNFMIDTQNATVPFGSTTWPSTNIAATDSSGKPNGLYTTNYYISYSIGPHGAFDKPAGWTGSRAYPGKLQQAASDVVKAQDALWQELSNAQGDKAALDTAVATFNSQVATMMEINSDQAQIIAYQQTINDTTASYNILNQFLQETVQAVAEAEQDIIAATPTIVIVGAADGGDEGKLVLSPILAALSIGKGAAVSADTVAYTVEQALTTDLQNRILNIQNSIGLAQWTETQRELVQQLATSLGNVQSHLLTINTKMRAVSDAQNAYQSLVGQGNQVQAERQTWREQVAGVIQGYRTQDVAYRLFRNERLERYKTLFDLAAKYALLAANAYDYETGLLDTDQGRQYVNSIVSSRALGVVENGEPQFAGSDTGDPGLSSALAEMKADWDVLKGRLGFNNPDAYGTTVSLRQEKYRLLPGQDGDSAWTAILQQGRMDNILNDQDVVRNCLSIDPGDGTPVPGIVLTFPTTVAKGYNLFGQPLAGGDHAITATAFATKIFAVGVALDGYIGMDTPNGPSDSGTNSVFLNGDALSATPDVYLIPIGVDSMRSPPLGDTQTIRSWSVSDVAIPVPFNIGGSDFSTAQLWQSSASLTEPIFAVRKHQAFRPVPSADYFNSPVYGLGNSLQRSQYTNSRLIGRSIWNSGWKLVIPGTTLLNDPNAGLDTFIRTVKDIQLYFQTYSYSGN